MSHSTFIDLRVNNAEQFKESISEPAPNTRIYLTIGKTNAWANDSAPTQSNTSIASIYEIWDNMIGGKKVVGSDVMHVIPRYNWTSNTTYIAYDDMNPNLLTSNNKLYVMNSEYSVYKCLANNSSQPSTIEPTSISPYITTQTSDGYIWKYMYTLSDVEKLRFMTDSYIPVKTISGDDGSLQWQVQNEAIHGAIDAIWVTNPGSQYSNANTITISITGDGEGAQALAQINTSSNTISSILITDSGTDYTWASVSVSDTGTGINGAARAIISPPGGHGSDPLYELAGKNVMINPKIRYSESGVLPVTNDFRQIALLKDPLLRGQSNVAIATAFLQAYTILLAGSGDYQEDEWVYQGTRLDTATFKGRVVSWDASLNSLVLINTYGTPTAASSLIGATSLTVRSITSATEGALQKYTGRILYMDNISPIVRASDQIEDFKLLVNF